MEITYSLRERKGDYLLPRVGLERIDEEEDYMTSRSYDSPLSLYSFLCLVFEFNEESRRRALMVEGSL